MSHFIFPTSAPGIGEFAGFGCAELQEEQLALWLKIRGSAQLEAFVYSGFTLSAAGGLSVNIASGTAMVDGYIIGTTGSETRDSLSDSTDNYIFAQLSFSGGLATDFSWIANTTGVAPADSVLIGMATCAGGSVTATYALNVLPRTTAGSYSGDGNTSRNILVGFQPKVLILEGGGTGGSVHSFVTAIGFGTGTLGDASGTFAGVVTDSGALMSDALATRPQITRWGFMVGGTSGGELNTSGQNYQWVAIP